jgi:hypothetical protein
MTAFPNMTATVLTSDATLQWRVAGGYSLGLDNLTVGKTGAYTATDADHTIRADATGGAFSVTLPDATVRPGREFLIVKMDSSANAVGITTTGGQTISGAASGSLTAQWKYMRVEATTTGWINVGSN